MPLSRRHLTRTLGLAAVLASTALVACTSTGTPTVTPAALVAQGAALANGLTNALAQVPAPLLAMIPAATLTQIKTWLALATGAANSLNTNLPGTTGASIAAQIDGWINAIVSTLAAPPINGLIPAPFNMAVGAAAILLPGFETLINGLLPASVTTAPVAAASLARAKLAPAGMNEAGALAVLQGFAGK